MYNLWYFVAFYTVLLQNLFFLAIFAVLSHDRFLRFTRYYVEKNLAKNSARGEKITNMRYVQMEISLIFPPCSSSLSKMTVDRLDVGHTGKKVFC